MGPEEGQKAPDFTLPTEENKPVTLSEELGEGPVVLSFNLFDFTGVCEEQACSFRDRLGELQGHGAKVFGISGDSPFVRKRFKEENGINYPLLSDYNKEVSKAYGVQYDDFIGFKGVAKRSVFVLDRGGIVRYRWVTEDNKIAPDIAEVLEAVKQVV